MTGWNCLQNAAHFSRGWRGTCQACLGMAIASQALVGVNELMVVAFKAGAEELTAAAEALGDTNRSQLEEGVIYVWIPCMCTCTQFQLYN